MLIKNLKHFNCILIVFGSQSECVIINILQVAELVVQLQKVLQQNAAKFFCNLFVTSPRIRDLKVIAVRSLLQSKFNFLPPQEPLQSLLQNLPPQEQITER